MVGVTVPECPLSGFFHPTLWPEGAPGALGDGPADRPTLIVRTPPAVLEAQLKAWDTVLAEQTKEPFFKKVIDSQKEWGKRVTAYWLNNNVDPGPAYKHFFG